MQIAIIGGGASGMVAAYLLDQQGHQVTVYERQSTLGGHIRTLNQNIPHDTDCPERLEAGVLEFPVEFTHFIRLMQDLAVPLEPVEVGSGMFFKNGQHYCSPVLIEHNFHGLEKWRELLQIDELYASAIGLWFKTKLVCEAQLKGKGLGEFLSADNPRTTWVKLLTMYSYSMPYDLIDDFPADLAIPALRRYVFCDWLRIKGGVYSYIEKILERFSGKVYCKAMIQAIYRSADIVKIVGQIEDKPVFHQQFDKVVFATPPDQVLHLLADPRPDEMKRFQAWRSNCATTILHSDRQLYRPYGIQQGSEFDFFQTDAGWGYNASLNQLCGISSNQAYHLAFNLRDAIDPAKIIHIQSHHTPLYNVESFKHRDAVLATNGLYNTYHVGAYLGDGLHEGAVTSAMNVAQAIGLAAGDWAAVGQNVTVPQPKAELLLR